MKTMILAAVLAVALMLTGCGGGSKGASMAGMPSGGGGGGTPTPQTYGPGRTIPLPTGHQLQTGTIPAGGSQTVEEPGGMERVIRCTAGSANCRIEVAEDGTVTLIAGNLQIVGLPDIPPPTPPTPPVTPPTPPVTPPNRVIEPPFTTWPTWEQLPARVDRMTHWTELPSGSLCADGVTACQAVVKTMLANGERGTANNFYPRASTDWTTLRTSRQSYGTWLKNSIFIFSDHPEHLISMGIRDTNPVTGVYRGQVHASHSVDTGANFELTYTSGATGGQLDMTVSAGLIPFGGPYTWTNVSVNNEGYFDNGITTSDSVGPNKLEGRFYQGGEVGGVFGYSYREGQDPNSFIDSGHGVFGGELVPASP